MSILLEDSMKVALRLATFSPDPSTQNGALVLDSVGNTIGGGCNTFTRGTFHDLNDMERSTKYLYVEHAERKALYDAVAKGNGNIIHTLVCPWAACAECARAIVEMGVKRLVRLPMEDDIIVIQDRWSESIARAEEIMANASVEIVEITGNFGIRLRRNGEIREF